MTAFPGVHLWVWDCHSRKGQKCRITPGPLPKRTFFNVMLISLKKKKKKKKTGTFTFNVMLYMSFLVLLKKLSVKIRCLHCVHLLSWEPFFFCLEAMSLEQKWLRFCFLTTLLLFWPGGLCRGWGTEGDVGIDEKQSLPRKGLADALGNSCKRRTICLASPGNLTLLRYPQTHARLQPSISSVLPSSKLSEWLACQSWHGWSVAKMGPGLYSASATDNNVRK